MTSNKQTSPYIKMDEVRDKLYEYVKHDGNDEFTKYVECVCNLVSYTDNMGDDFMKPLLHELEVLLKYYQENTTVVKKEVTNTVIIMEVEHH